MYCRAYLCLGEPGEVQAVGVAGHGHDEGESEVADHVVPHVVQLRVEPCRGTRSDR